MSATQTTANAGTFHAAMPLDKIAASKTNPRKHFDATEQAELAASIREKGVIEPIIVRPHPQKKGHCELVAGERRWRASKDAGVPTIPAIERDLDDKSVLEIQVIENLQRADVHELDEAQGYDRLMKEAKYDVALLAAKIGKSEGYIYARLKLLNLIKELQVKFLDGTITAGHAILLARLPESSQIAAAKRLFETDHHQGKSQSYVVSVRELSNWIQTEIQMDLLKTLFDKEDAKLLPAAGACSACPKRTGAEPQLWPELQNKDQCTDNACFNRKINAHIKVKVDAGEMVKLTEDYQQKAKSGLYYSYDFSEVKGKPCDSTVTGIYVDGYRRGQTKKICTNNSCKLHHGRNGSSGTQRRIVTPTERYNNAKTSIAQTAAAEHRRMLYEAALPKLEICSLDLEKSARKSALNVAVRLVYDRLDSSVRNAVDKEMKLTGGRYGAKSGIAIHAAKLNVPQLLTLISRLVLKNLSLGYTGSWAADRDDATKNLEAFATELGVKVRPIADEIAQLKKEKLDKAKKRMDAAQAAKKSKKKTLQTSAKSKSKTDPEELEDDAEGSYDDDPEMDE